MPIGLLVNHQTAVDRNLAERYLLGELDTAEAAEFEEHFFDCPACSEDVRQANRMVANLKAVLRENTLIEIGPNDRFVDLRIEVNAASAACVAVECEFQPGVGEPVGMMASPSNGWIHLVLPADRLYAGSWTLILRDANSGQEIERRRLDITKKSEE